MAEDPKLDFLITILDWAVRWKDKELERVTINSIIAHTVPPRKRKDFNPDDTTKES